MGDWQADNTQGVDACIRVAATRQRHKGQLFDELYRLSSDAGWSRAFEQMCLENTTYNLRPANNWWGANITRG